MPNQRLAPASVCLFIEDLPVWAFMTARAFQGTSAAVVCNLGLALLVDTFGLHIAGEKLGYALSSATFGVISSSLLGGLLYEHAGYHAVVGMILGLVGINLVVRLLVIEKKLAQTWKGSDVSEGKASEAWYPNGQGTTEVGGGLQAYSEPFPRPRFGGVGSALDGTRIACESDRLLPTSNSCRAKESSKPLILHLVKEPRILADTYAVFTVNVLFASFDSNLGIFVKKRFGWGPICVGAIYLTIAVPPLLSPVTNSLSRKFGARWIAAGGFVASSGFTTLLSLVSTDDVPHAVALCVLMTIIEAVGREQKHTSGETAAFVQAFSILLWASAAGTVVGPLFTGFAGDLLGWGNMNICLDIAEYAPTDALLRCLSISPARRKSDDTEPQLNHVSHHITQPKSQGASQAMLYATGLQPSDMSKAQVGISSVWYSGNPCNMHLLELNHKVKEGVERAGLIGYQFNTVGVSDAISMGTKGMRYSLQSRDLIADSIETVMGGQWYDANISIPGCDKNMPGVVMAMGRVNRPSIMVYGGTIKPGCAATQNNADIDIISAFQSYGQFITGEINEEERFDIIRNACPGGGACGGMYTANTMATAIETIGMTLPGSSSNPAESKAKMLECLAAGGAIKNLLKEGIRPTDIITRKSLEEAIAVIMITGGSTNAVLHLIAIAHSVGIELKIDDFQAISDRTPFLADLKPSGKYVMADLHNIGGTPSLLKYLLKEGVISGKGITVTGQTLAKNVENVPDFPSDQVIIKPMSNPIKDTGHIQILRGSLAPDGCVGKITGKEGTEFKGKARVFDSEDDMVLSLEQGAIKKGEKTVVIIRYEGPKGGPGMPEMLKPSSAIMGAGLGKDVALVTDGRFSGGSHGFLIGHIVPEAHVGGPIALVRDGDEIVIDAKTRRLDVLVGEEELASRRREWREPPLKYKKGTLRKYGQLVSDASHGCITDY
ncbi:MAG: hypothetical protein L6R37_001169 [Teloschistes peruensis]|nr:MAG: hypothetical protein L6R37_001169 [Teloschistes peruensis]